MIYTKMFLRKTLTNPRSQRQIWFISAKRCHTNTHDQETDKKFTLENKTAIVNGGASGIGFAITREFLKRGLHQITIIDNDEEKGDNAAARLCKEFGSDRVLFFEADVANSLKLDDVYRKSIQFHDVPNIIINSAGMMNDMEWQKQIWTNMTGCVLGTLLGLQYMSRSSKGYGGIIVNIGSIFGIIPSSGFPLHTMTQFGICGFSKALGCEAECILGNHIHRTGVKVFALCPGLTNTNLLIQAPKKTINEGFAQEYAEEVEGSQPQMPLNVAKGLIEILDIAKPGSVWVAENDRLPFEVHYPGNVLEAKKEATYSKMS